MTLHNKIIADSTPSNPEEEVSPEDAIHRMVIATLGKSSGISPDLLNVLGESFNDITNTFHQGLNIQAYDIEGIGELISQKNDPIEALFFLVETIRDTLRSSCEVQLSDLREHYKESLPKALKIFIEEKILVESPIGSEKYFLTTNGLEYLKFFSERQSRNNLPAEEKELSGPLLRLANKHIRGALLNNPHPFLLENWVRTTPISNLISHVLLQSHDLEKANERKTTPYNAASLLACCLSYALHKGRPIPKIDAFFDKLESAVASKSTQGDMIPYINCLLSYRLIQKRSKDNPLFELLTTQGLLQKLAEKYPRVEVNLCQTVIFLMQALLINEDYEKLHDLTHAFTQILLREVRFGMKLEIRKESILDQIRFATSYFIYLLLEPDRHHLSEPERELVGNTVRLIYYQCARELGVELNHKVPANAQLNTILSGEERFTIPLQDFIKPPTIFTQQTASEIATLKKDKLENPFAPHLFEADNVGKSITKDRVARLWLTIAETCMIDGLLSSPTAIPSDLLWQPHKDFTDLMKLTYSSPYEAISTTPFFALFPQLINDPKLISSRPTPYLVDLLRFAPRSPGVGPIFLWFYRLSQTCNPEPAKELLRHLETFLSEIFAKKTHEFRDDFPKILALIHEPNVAEHIKQNILTSIGNIFSSHFLIRHLLTETPYSKKNLKTLNRLYRPFADMNLADKEICEVYFKTTNSQKIQSKLDNIHTVVVSELKKLSPQAQTVETTQPQTVPVQNPKLKELEDLLSSENPYDNKIEALRKYIDDNPDQKKNKNAYYSLINLLKAKAQWLDKRALEILSFLISDESYLADQDESKQQLEQKIKTAESEAKNLKLEIESIRNNMAMPVAPREAPIEQSTPVTEIIPDPKIQRPFDTFSAIIKVPTSEIINTLAAVEELKPDFAQAQGLVEGEVFPVDVRRIDPKSPLYQQIIKMSGYKQGTGLLIEIEVKNIAGTIMMEVDKDGNLSLCEVPEGIEYEPLKLLLQKTILELLIPEKTRTISIRVPSGRSVRVSKLAPPQLNKIANCFIDYSKIKGRFEFHHGNRVLSTKTDSPEEIVEIMAHTGYYEILNFDKFSFKDKLDIRPKITKLKPLTFEEAEQKIKEGSNTIGSFRYTNMWFRDIQTPANEKQLGKYLNHFHGIPGDEHSINLWARGFINGVHKDPNIIINADNPFGIGFRRNLITVIKSSNSIETPAYGAIHTTCVWQHVQFSRIRQ